MGCVHSEISIIIILEIILFWNVETTLSWSPQIILSSNKIQTIFFWFVNKSRYMHCPPDCQCEKLVGYHGVTWPEWTIQLPGNHFTRNEIQIWCTGKKSIVVNECEGKPQINIVTTWSTTLISCLYHALCSWLNIFSLCCEHVWTWTNMVGILDYHEILANMSRLQLLSNMKHGQNMISVVWQCLEPEHIQTCSGSKHCQNMIGV